MGRLLMASLLLLGLTTLVACNTDDELKADLNAMETRIADISAEADGTVSALERRIEALEVEFTALKLEQGKVAAALEQRESQVRELAAPRIEIPELPEDICYHALSVQRSLLYEFVPGRELRGCYDRGTFQARGAESLWRRGETTALRLCRYD